MRLCLFVEDWFRPAGQICVNRFPSSIYTDMNMSVLTQVELMWPNMQKHDWDTQRAGLFSLVHKSLHKYKHIEYIIILGARSRIRRLIWMNIFNILNTQLMVGTPTLLYLNPVFGAQHSGLSSSTRLQTPSSSSLVISYIYLIRTLYLLYFTTFVGNIQASPSLFNPLIVINSNHYYPPTITANLILSLLSNY